MVVSRSASGVGFSNILFFCFSFFLDFLLLDSGDDCATSNEKLANPARTKALNLCHNESCGSLSPEIDFAMLAKALVGASWLENTAISLTIWG